MSSNWLATTQPVLQALIEPTADFKDGNITEAVLRDAAERALNAVIAGVEEAELQTRIDQLVAWAEMHFTVRQDEAPRLLGEAEHQPWVKDQLVNLFPDDGWWKHFRRHVKQGLPARALDRLDRTTDDILDRLEDPHRGGQWDRRGLVMGQVQSGKTNNYLALAAKAMDAGYPLIVIMAGVHNNLRSQTQQRVDAGLIGRDTRLGLASTRKIGVGNFPGHKRPITLTSADESGDFKRATAQQVGNPFDQIDTPHLFIVKKHVTILDNLREWLRSNADLQEGHDRIKNVPILLIDDEADSASIDTSSDPDTDPTRTNGMIRQLLQLFDRSAYVGYTATPFANVFIDDKAESDEFGADLFPRDFIFTIEPPSNYVGPASVFGVAGDGSGAEEAGGGAPVVRTVSDAEDWLPSNHKKDWRPPHLPGSAGESVPDSLVTALDGFVLAAAARRVRSGAGSNNSMLVHVTRFTDPQERVKEELTDLYGSFRDAILYNPESVVWTRLRDLWETDFIPTSAAMASAHHGSSQHSFDELIGAIKQVAPSIEIRSVNGSSADVLDYESYPNGLNVVVVGGQKLSRGLTLEGLTTSYYLRTSRMYDTLMQMGRWFGYRDGYLDLCRVYTSRDVVRWFRAISRATDELTADFRDMQASNRRPKDFGLRVRHSPGMMITSAAKMRNNRTVRMSFGGQRPETTTFDIRPERRELALRIAGELVDKLDLDGRAEPRKSTGNHTWHNVDAKVIHEFLDALAHENLYITSKARPRELVDYLRKRARAGALTSWTVSVRSNSQSNKAPQVVGTTGLSVGLSRRTDESGGDGYVIRSLIGSSDEALDFSPLEIERLKEDNDGALPFGFKLRALRPEKRGLLILYILDPLPDTKANPPAQPDKGTAEHIEGDVPFVGWCISLPTDPDPDGNAVEYRVNSVYMEMDDRMEQALT